MKTLLLPVLAAAVILLGLSLLFSGCYTLKQGITMLGYLNRAVPLERLKAAPPEDPDSEKNLRFVERIEAIRRFALSLGLRDTKNYTRYVALDRDYLAAVVSASAADSFARHEWRFPVAGSVPYKGFFNPADAQKEGRALQKKGLDVWIRRVDAFSTLGWFQDPLYSYMRDYPAHRLAELIIHETLHATVYLPGHSQFNEELAEFTGRQGARLYMERTYGPDSQEWREMIDAEADQAAYLAFIQGLIAELDALYSGGAGGGHSREEVLRRKEAVIAEAKRRFEEEYDDRFRGDTYRGFLELPVNNAYLELYRLYYGGGGRLDELYRQSGGDLARFIEAAKGLNDRAGRREDPWIRLEQEMRFAGPRPRPVP